MTAMVNHARPMIVFDKHCRLCSTSMAFVIRHDRRHRFRLVAPQSRLGRSAYLDHELHPDGLTTMIVLAEGRVQRGIAITASWTVM